MSEMDDWPQTHAEAEAMFSEIKDAGKKYREDVRFRRLVDTAVVSAVRDVQDAYPYRSDKDDRSVHEIASQACAMLLAMIYHNDSEIRHVRAEHDRMAKAYAQLINIRPMPPLFTDVVS